MFSTATMPRLWSSGARRPPQDEPPLPNRSTFKSALEHIAVTDAFLRGINVFKVTPKGKLEPATLTISRDKFIISVLPRTLKVERSGSSGVGGLKRPSILSRVRSNGQSVGSVGSGSLGNSVEGAEAAFFSSNPQAVVDIGSIDRIQSGQNTLLFEKARWVCVPIKSRACFTFVSLSLAYFSIFCWFIQTTGEKANHVYA